MKTLLISFALAFLSPTLFAEQVITLSDGSGNSATATQTVTVTIDAIQPPVPDLEVLSDLVQQCAVDFEQLVVPTATDYLGQTVSGTTDSGIFPLTEPGSYEIIWTYTDGEGNVATQVQTIVISGNAQNLGNVDCGFDIRQLASRFGESVFDPFLSDVKVLEDGNILIAGVFNEAQGVTVGNLVRYIPDGTLDETFKPIFDAQVYVITVQKDGKILAGGSFNTVNGQNINRIVRLNPDGSIDETFNTGTGFNALVRNIAVQRDGKIVVVGDFNSFNDAPSPAIVRLNTNGSLDSEFNLTRNLTGPIIALGIQSDDKIVLGGAIVENLGANRRLLRLNSDGSLDISLFVDLGENGTVTDLAIQDYGKIVVVGSFTSVGGTSRNRIARFNRDGTLDNSFNSGNGFSEQVFMRRVFSRKDRGMFVGGGFTNYNGNPSSRIVAINADGSIDSRYNFGTGASSNVQGIAQQSDGNLIVVALYNSFDGVQRRGVTRVFAELGERPPLADFEDYIFPIEGNDIQGYQWVDYDNDGDLDFLVLAPTGSLMYINDGNGVFSPVQVGIPNFVGFKVAWGDIDGDGDMDLFINGFLDGVSVSKIYENRGAEGFVDINAGIINLRSAEAKWGDYDNDGDLDLIIVGDVRNVTNNTFEAYTRIYRNEGNGVFTDIQADIAQLHVGAVSWVDFDNDGDLDILLAGNTSSNAGSIPTTKIYRNDGNDTFTDIQVNIPGLFEPAADWGDYDNDGDLDLFINGRRADFSPFQMLYRNDGNGAFTPVNINVSPSWAGSAQWGDFDNDGKLDLFVSGFDNKPFSDPNKFVGSIYRNLGNDQFEELIVDGLPRTYFTTGGWGDFDNDGDLDLMVSGINGSFRRVLYVFKNNHVEKGGNANTLPTAPGNLLSSVNFEAQEVSLNWAAASDGETPDASLSYNVYIREVGSSSFAKSAQSDISNGWRKIPQSGNTMLGKAFVWNISPEDLEKNYEWSVQAVDGAFAGSPFAPIAQFSLINTPSCSVVALANNLTVALDRNGVASITTRQANNGSFSECAGGNLTITLSQSSFSCADLGENQVTLTATDREGNVGSTLFTVTVVDNIAPTIAKLPRTVKVSIAANTSYTVPDFRLTYPASDNCSVVDYTQSPAPGTVYTSAGVYPVTLTATDQSGNVTSGTFNIELSVTQPRGGGRKNSIDMNSVLSVAWNTPFSDIENMEILMVDEAGEERSYRVTWNADDYDPLTPGFYQIRGTALENISFRFKPRDEEPVMHVFVEDKPGAISIELDSNTYPSNMISGQVVGRLYTIDPVDDIHSYSLDNHPQISLMGDEIIWNSQEKPAASLNITVHSTDRAGQTISRELTLNREVDPNRILIYPNPATTESNILVQLSGESDVTIRVFDAAGRVVYEEQERQSETFVRNLNLRGLSSGLYHVVVQIDNKVLTGRLVKDL